MTLKQQERLIDVLLNTGARLQLQLVRRRLDDFPPAKAHVIAARQLLLLAAEDLRSGRRE